MNIKKAIKIKQNKTVYYACKSRDNRKYSHNEKPFYLG
jgi:hypothetical protein